MFIAGDSRCEMIEGNIYCQILTEPYVSEIDLAQFEVVEEQEPEPVGVQQPTQNRASSFLANIGTRLIIRYAPVISVAAVFMSNSGCAATSYYVGGREPQLDVDGENFSYENGIMTALGHGLDRTPESALERARFIMFLRAVEIWTEFPEEGCMCNFGDGYYADMIERQGEVFGIVEDYQERYVGIHLPDLNCIQYPLRSGNFVYECTATYSLAEFYCHQ